MINEYNRSQDRGVSAGLQRAHQEQGVDKATKRQKLIEGEPIVVGIDSGAEECKKNHRKGNYMHREESLHDSTAIHLQGNRTFRGP